MEDQINEQFRVRKDWSYLILILLLTLVAYSSLLNNDFVSWDDPMYFHENPLIKSIAPEGIKTIFTTLEYVNYHPLTTLSNAIEYYFFGLNPKVYHLNNFLLHVFNILLVFFLIRGLNKSIEFAAIIALIFAIHPMHVESVVWASERKDVLYAFFYLAGLYTYVQHLKRGHNKYRYFTLVLFLLSLLSKPAAVSFPLILLCMDFYFGKSLKPKAQLDKIPFFALALIFGLINVIAQDIGGATGYQIGFSAFDRIFLVCYAFLFYIQRFFFPFKLSAIYAYPEKIDGALPVELYLSAVIIVVCVVLLFRYSRKKDYLFGFWFYVCTIILVLQIFPAGDNLTADRFSYLPYIGLSFGVASGLQAWIEKLALNKIVLTSVVSLLFFGMGMLCYQQVKVWENSKALYFNVIQQTPQNAYSAYYNMAIDEEEAENYPLALKLYDLAIKERPDEAMSYNNRGIIKLHLGNYEGAMQDFGKSIQLNPDLGFGQRNMNVLISDIDRLDRLITFYSDGVKRNPDAFADYLSRGVIRYMRGEKTEACEDFQKAAALGNKEAPKIIEMYCPE